MLMVFFCGYCWSEGTYAYTALLYQEAVKRKPFVVVLKNLISSFISVDLWGSCMSPITSLHVKELPVSSAINGR